MELQDIILIPIYVFIALLIIKILRIDAWIDWFLKLFKAPDHLEKKISNIEKRIIELENKIAQ